MATLYVTEYAGTGYVTSAQNPNRVNVQAALEPALVNQTLAISGVSQASNAFQNAPGPTNGGQGSVTYLIRVHSDSICSVEVGAAPVATTASKRFVAGQTEYFSVYPGHKIAVITNV